MITWDSELPRLVSSILGVLGFIGFCISIYHVFIALRHGKELKTLVGSVHADSLTLANLVTASQADSDRLKGLVESVTTRFLDAFPNSMVDILKLVDGANRTLEIYCDVPGYGMFTSAGVYRKYAISIGRQIHKIVSCVFLQNDRVLSLREEQFEDAVRDWKEWFRRPDTVKSWEGFCSEEGLDPNVAPDDAAAFFGLLQNAQEREPMETFGRCRRHLLSVNMPVYFWIADGKTAIFSIPTIAGSKTEFAFETADPRLIEALRAIRERSVSSPGAKHIEAKSIREPPGRPEHGSYR